MSEGSRKAVDERLYLSKAKGGGLLRREIWVDLQGRVVRYNLAYIHPQLPSNTRKTECGASQLLTPPLVRTAPFALYPRDHHRVLGYDSGHGDHHRHYKGKVTASGVANFEEAERRFEMDEAGRAGES